MSMTGELYRISAGQIEELLADPSRIVEELSSADNSSNERKACSVEKTWNAIEFMLDRLAELGCIPWIGPLTEGTETGASLHYGPVWYRTPQEVSDLAKVLSGISRNEFRRGFMPDLMSKHRVYPHIWDEGDKEALFDYVWDWYTPMVRFYQQAADHGDGMLLWTG